MGLLWQFFGTAVVCYLSLVMGSTFTWPSSTITLFASEQNTTLTRAMTEAELSLLGSLSSVGALIATPVFGYVLDVIGRRYSMIIAGVPYLVSWAMIAGAHEVEVILAAMFVSGIGGAAFLVTPVFVSEICEDNIRGSMTSGVIIFIGLGSLFSYLSGGYLPYHTNVYLQLTLVVVYMLLVYFIKESPIFLMQKGKEEEAAKSIAFYRSVSIDSKEVLEEILKMKRILSTGAEGEYTAVSTEPDPSDEKLNIEEVAAKPTNIAPWKFLRKSKSSQRGLFISLVLVTSSIFMGLVVIQVYAQPIFEKIIPSMSASLSAIVFALVCIFASLLSAYLIEAAGRKALMIGSAISSGVCTLVLGTQLQLNWGPDLLVPIVIYLFCICFSLGAGAIPYVLIAELFLPEVKSFCSMIAVEWAWLTNFFILLIFNPLVSSLGLGNVFYIFSSICFVTALFSYFCQPETKGLSIDVIQSKLVKNK